MLSMLHVTETAPARVEAWKTRIIPALLAAALGLALTGVAGFAETPMLHNAAHDSRHASAFPCH